MLDLRGVSGSKPDTPSLSRREFLLRSVVFGAACVAAREEARAELEQTVTTSTTFESASVFAEPYIPSTDEVGEALGNTLMVGLANKVASAFYFAFNQKSRTAVRVDEGEHDSPIGAVFRIGLQELGFRWGWPKFFGDHKLNLFISAFFFGRSQDCHFGYSRDGKGFTIYSRDDVGLAEDYFLGALLYRTRVTSGFLLSTAMRLLYEAGDRIICKLLKRADENLEL